MSDMTMNEAYQVIQGVIRFQRALMMIKETLEKAMEGESFLAGLDWQKLEKQTLIDAAEESLAASIKTLANKKGLLDTALNENKVRVEAQNAALLEAKQREIDSLQETIAGLGEQIFSSQETVKSLVKQRSILQDEIEAAQSLLADIKKEQEAVLAKFR